MKVTVSGIDAAIKFNERIVDEKRHDAMMKEILTDTVSLIRSKAPVDTGRLLNSIRFKQEGKLKYRIVVDVPYAIYMEYGFRGFNIGTVEQPKFMKSGYHPFIRSSVWEMNQDQKKYIRSIIFGKY